MGKGQGRGRLQGAAGGRMAPLRPRTRLQHRLRDPPLPADLLRAGKLRATAECDERIRGAGDWGGGVGEGHRLKNSRRYPESAERKRMSNSDSAASASPREILFSTPRRNNSLEPA